jgi:hypothetical protein
VDGRRDHVDCGPGKDTVKADRLDKLKNCESKTRTQPRRRVRAG